MSKKDHEKQWVAYSCCAGLEFFDTQDDAELWTLEIEQDEEICPDAMGGCCFVAKVASRTDFVADETDEGSEFDEVGHLEFVPLNGRGAGRV